MKGDKSSARKRRWLKILSVTSPQRLYFYSVLVGCIAGGMTVLFTYGLAYVENFFLVYLCNIKIGHPDSEFFIPIFSTFSSSYGRYLILVIPAIGGLLGGILVHYLSEQSKGIGTDAMIMSFHTQEGRIKISTPFVKAAATILTLGSGGSAGKEGPMALIGAGLGSIFSRVLNMGARARRTLLLAGAAGGLGAMFKAPLGGALTAIEVVYKEDLEADSLIPCILSSVTAYIIYCSFFSFERLFNISPVYFHHPVELFFYIGLGFLCVFVGKVYIRYFYFIRNRIFTPLPVHPILKPAIGGLCVGAIGWFYPETLGSSFGFLQEMLGNRLDGSPLELLRLFLIIAVLKIITSSLTLGSGGSGGVFAPSIAIGALLGGGVGTLAHYLFPDYFYSHVPYIIVGMCAFFAGVAHAPMATLIMVCEITGGYNVLPPLLLVSMITIIFNSKESIYENQISNRFASPAHIWDMNVDLLKLILIRDVPFSESLKTPSNLNIISDDLPMSKMRELAIDSKSNDFIVKNENGEYLGGASLGRIESQVDLGLLAYDLMEEKRTVNLNDDLSTAIQNMLYDNVDKIAIVEGKKLLGVIEYKTIMKLYRGKIAEYTKMRDA